MDSQAPSTSPSNESTVAKDALQIRSLRDIEQNYFNADSELGERYPIPEDFNVMISKREASSTYALEKRFMSDKIRAAQKPEETLLELLTVMAAQNSDIEPDDVILDDFGRVQFLMARQMKLRRILFNNPYLDFFDNRADLSDEQKWEQWGKAFIKSNVREVKSERTEEELLQDDNRNLEFLVYTKAKASRSKNSVVGYRVMNIEDISQIRANFKSFADFTKAVTLLRSWAFINPGKQWCYNFLFPFGPDCLFFEITKDHEFKFNYLSFAGTLLFSMLQRSSDQQSFHIICSEIHKRFLDSNNAFNMLAQKIESRNAQDWLNQFKQDVATQKIKKTRYYDSENKQQLNSFMTNSSIFLPFKHHRVFDQLSADFVNLLTLKIPLNQRDLFNALSVISTLNLMVYYLESSKALNALCGVDSNIDMVVECCHENGRNLRRLSSSRLNANDEILKRSIANMTKLYLKDMFPDCTPDSMLSSNEFTQVIEALDESFHFGSKFRNSCAFTDCCVSENEDFAELEVSLKEEELHSQVAQEEDGQQNVQVSHDTNPSQFQSDLSNSQRSDKTQVSREKKARFGKIQEKVLSFVEQGGANFTGLHRNYGRFIGLASRQHSRAYRYELPDELLRVLVLTTVDKNEQLMLLDDFLARIYQKYHFVIGPKEGEQYCVSKRTVGQGVEDALFSDNLDAFKVQLSRLGFLISLSDTAAYIKNPYLA